MADHLIFTISAGRTGTAWLADLLKANLVPGAIHEPIGPRDFGVRMPEIGTMRTFNEDGMVDRVRQFWDRKAMTIPETGPYAETNHTLAKCGLIEFLAEANPAPKISIICLRRNWVDQALSYIRRRDFLSSTVIWQWYLDPHCARKIVDPRSLKGLGAQIPMFWYMAEMEARQAYYRRLFGNRMSFIDCTIENISEPPGAAQLLADLGHDGRLPLSLPPPSNTTPKSEIKGAEPSKRATIAATMENIRFDAEDVAQRFIESGMRLSVPS